MVAERNDQNPLSPAWEFPGGKVELGESSSEAIIREVQEELGLELQKIEPFLTLLQRKPNGAFWSLTLFYSYVPDQRVEVKEHRQIRWVQAPQLKDIPFMDTNLGFLDPLLVLFQTSRKRPI